MTTEQWLTTYGWVFGIAAVFVLLVALNRLWLRLLGVVLIPQDSIGIVNKKFVVAGTQRSLPNGAVVALSGEAGWQADTLAPGVHYGYWPWQYEVKVEKFVQIPEDKVGIVEARDGQPLMAGRVLARHIDCQLFQDARAFLTNGGERGGQITVIPPGTYRINTMLFTVDTVPQCVIPDNKVGVVTTLEGTPLAAGEIAGATISGHSSFQNGQMFLDGGGTKGLQEQVVLAGRYFFNPQFVDIEIVEMTTVPIAHVGVVISYVGKAGKDVTGATFKHGNLVSRGEKGVWVDALDPGKYPINPFTHKIENVPTANVVLNWATGKSEAHKLDANLSTIKVRSSDGYSFSLDVSQIIHIPGTDAPKVIARFGKVENLVTQVLEPTIGNYFRNAAQGSDVIDFLRKRQERQNDAKVRIAEALQEYNVAAVDTLIGDIVPPEQLMKTLTDRKLAEQQRVTFETERLAEVQRKELEQARATAETQASVVKAERDVEISEFDAKAAVKKAEGQKQAAILAAEGTASATITNAGAEAQRLRLTGEAEAAKVKAVGVAEADVIKLKIASMDSGNYAGIEIAKALSSGHLKLVPEIFVGGTSEGNGLATALMAQMLRGNTGGGNGHAVQMIDQPKK